MKQSFPGVAMKRIAQSKLFLSIIICSSCFLLCQLAFGLNYEMLDEMIFSELLADNYIHFGNFSNYFLLAAIMLLQKLIYPVNAYVIVSLAAALAAMVTIVYIFYSRFSWMVATVIAVVLNGMFGVNHYATISFTRLPALLCAGGLLCIIHTIYSKRWVAGYIWGSLLVIAASMYRYKIFLVGALLLVVFLVADSVAEHLSFKNTREAVKSFLKELLEPKRLLCGVLLFAVCFGFSAFGRHLNNNSEAVSYYIHYNSLRSAVWDYEIPTYDEAKDDYDAINIDANDLTVLKGHFLDDEGAFTIDKLKEINAIKEKYNEKRSLKTILKSLIFGELEELTSRQMKAILYLSVLLILVLFLIIMKKRYMLIPFSLLAASAVLYVYLYFDGRVPYRVVYGIWLPVILYLLYSIRLERLRDFCRQKLRKNQLLTSKKYAVPIVVLALFVAVAFLTINDQKNYKNDYAAMQSDRASVNEYVKAHPDDRFELCRMANLFEGNIDNKTIYTVNNEGRYKNSHIFNGTYYRLPYYDKFNKDVFGTDNMYENLLKDNVYFIDHNNAFSKALEKYLEKYYADGNNVDMTLIDEFDNYQIVSYTMTE